MEGGEKRQGDVMKRKKGKKRRPEEGRAREDKKSWKETSRGEVMK